MSNPIIDSNVVVVEAASAAEVAAAVKAALGNFDAASVAQVRVKADKRLLAGLYDLASGIVVTYVSAPGDTRADGAAKRLGGAGITVHTAEVIAARCSDVIAALADRDAQRAAHKASVRAVGQVLPALTQDLQGLVLQFRGCLGRKSPDLKRFGIAPVVGTKPRGKGKVKAAGAAEPKVP